MAGFSEGLAACTTVPDLIRFVGDAGWSESALDMAVERYHQILGEIPIKSAEPRKVDPTRAEAAIVELIETVPGPTDLGVMKPNQIRINGVPILVPKEDFLTIEGANGEDELVAVVRMFARRIVIGEPL